MQHMWWYLRSGSYRVLASPQASTASAKPERFMRSWFGGSQGEAHCNRCSSAAAFQCSRRGRHHKGASGTARAYPNGAGEWVKPQQRSSRRCAQAVAGVSCSYENLPGFNIDSLSGYLASDLHLAGGQQAQHSRAGCSTRPHDRGGTWKGRRLLLVHLPARHPAHRVPGNN